MKKSSAFSPKTDYNTEDFEHYPAILSKIHPRPRDFCKSLAPPTNLHMGQYVSHTMELVGAVVEPVDNNSRNSIAYQAL